MKFITFNFNFRLFLYLVSGFVLCTIVGTVSHEFGHGAIASLQGRDWQLHYASMSPGRPAWFKELNAEYEKNKDLIDREKASPEKEAYLKFRRSLAKKYKNEDLYMRLGGPVQTMITGTIGFLVLWFRRKKLKDHECLTATTWLLVLLAFFWSRQPAILLQKIYYTLIGYHGRGDEENIARHLHLNEWSVISIWGLVGAIILFWVTFYVIPLKLRLTFITAGLTGSLAGAALWFGIAGPVLLP